MKLFAGLAAVALVATAVTSAPASAAPVDARSKKSFSLTVDFTGRQFAPSGNARGIGDLTVATGRGSGTVGTAAITVVMRVVAPSSKKDAEFRDTQTQVQFKDGQLFAQATNEDPKGKPSQTVHIMPITGGSGAYAGAHGTLTMIPQPRTGKYLMMVDVFTEKSLARTSLNFAAPTSVTAGSGVGAVSVMRAVRDERSYIAVSTSLASARNSPRRSVDLQLFDGNSTIFARTITQGGAKATTYAVLGGTGTYAGARGELVLSGNGRTITLRIATPRGKGTPLSWVNRVKRSVTIEAPTGSSTYTSGDASPAKGNRPRGDFFSTSLVYPEIDGITPIVAMVEQGFNMGTLVITGMHTEATSRRLPIAGGTADLVGAAGTALIDAARPAQVRMSGTFWR